jgi:hypothetical protein
LQLQKDAKNGNVVMKTKKFRPHDRYDDREICPYCTAHISVAAHSGLPEYRRLLFQSHTQTSASPAPGQAHIATFACSGCYKTFDDSYAFLDHIFQKEIDSERSCVRIPANPRFSVGSAFTRSDSKLVEKCLRNCLRREMTRAKMLKREGSDESSNTMGSSNTTGETEVEVGKRVEIGEKRDSAMSMGKETQIRVRSVDSRYSSNFFGQGVEGY